MAPGFFQLFRQNWKKSSLFLASSHLALWYTYDYTVTNDVIRTACKRAVVYGDERLKNPNSTTRHITVILNPVACKRKSKKLYAKWVEPLLHLAGIKVSVIETESPNQAFDLMKIMSNCDGVAIVGGDGTVTEAINGLLSRPDCAKAAKEIPIAILPAGQYNTIARYIHQGYLPYRNQKEFLVQATLKLIDSSMEKYDVLKITPVNEELRSKEDPIFALRDVKYGKFQDNCIKLNGYLFYQTNIRPYWLQFKRFLGSSIVPRIQSIAYTEPCKGCSRCYEKHRLPEVLATPGDEDMSANKRWWGMLAPKSNQVPNQSEDDKKEAELAKLDNPECDRWLRIENVVDITDFKASMMGDKKVRLSMARFGELKPSETIETQDVRLKLVPDLDEQRLESLQEENTKTPDDSEETEKIRKEEEDRKIKFLIDNQPKQAHSIEITSLSKAITIFTGPYT